MDLSADEARELFANARAAHMATVGADGQPHVVVHTFAVSGDWIFHAVDHKPKRSTNLKRIRNIREHPAVSVLVDQYNDSDWERLWWVRADGDAYVLELDEERADPVGLLTAKYPQYREHPPEGPVIAVQVKRWTGWAYSGPPGRPT